MDKKKRDVECSNICGRRCEVYSRCVGYLRPVNQWNLGKQQEYKDRKVFKI
jgi:ribonucleoside-triphosphate reductase